MSSASVGTNEICTAIISATDDETTRLTGQWTCEGRGEIYGDIRESVWRTKTCEARNKPTRLGNLIVPGRSERQNVDLGDYDRNMFILIWKIVTKIPCSLLLNEWIRQGKAREIMNFRKDQVHNKTSWFVALCTHLQTNLKSTLCN